MTRYTETRDLLEELRFVNESFERSTPLKILEWTFERFNDDVAMACSFEERRATARCSSLRPILNHLLDTREFPRDARIRVTNRARWSLNMTRTTPGADADAWPCGTNDLRTSQSRAARRAVTGKSAWITSGETSRRAVAYEHENPDGGMRNSNS